jgi:Zn ribbon nucleic-acid-binding protein
MTSTLTPPPETAERPIAGERCDRCSAAAKLRVTLAGGGDLVFCGHHANQYADQLVPIAVGFNAEPEFEWRGSDLMASEN